jgi:multicomponent Na+:H+ antiporter subunit F
MNDMIFVVVSIAAAFLGLALIACLWRVIRGPTFADRVLSLDMISIIVIGFVALYAVESNAAVILDVTVVVAVLAFLSTVAFAYLIEKQGLR